jgi:hypothetical protein
MAATSRHLANPHAAPRLACHHPSFPWCRPRTVFGPRITYLQTVSDTIRGYLDVDLSTLYPQPLLLGTAGPSPATNKKNWHRELKMECTDVKLCSGDKTLMASPMASLLHGAIYKPCSCGQLRGRYLYSTWFSSGSGTKPVCPSLTRLQKYPPLALFLTAGASTCVAMHAPQVISRGSDRDQQLGCYAGA